MLVFPQGCIKQPLEKSTVRHCGIGVEGSLRAVSVFRPDLWSAEPCEPRQHHICDEPEKHGNPDIAV